MAQDRLARRVSVKVRRAHLDAKAATVEQNLGVRWPPVAISHHRFRLIGLVWPEDHAGADQAVRVMEAGAVFVEEVERPRHHPVIPAITTVRHDRHLRDIGCDRRKAFGTAGEEQVIEGLHGGILQKNNRARR